MGGKNGFFTRLHTGHGPDGLEGESGKVEASLTVARQNEAVQSLIDLAQKHSGEVVIAAIGPLTNIR
ncbi:hypothetical protein PsorP6_002914 [Peronosclerospora sorghi]|uniref:Uncharacterized protein n=1 Tax=Peronosclerospora sorghi TaxID=230839 RepID=A0ACC0VLC3_9STRA|nr:hypothetical protein PsorP6_002914 [Peronosclerospora sorghi]